MSMIIEEQNGGVRIVTLNNPERYNALGGTLMPDLAGALTRANADPAVRAILLTGKGKGFCAGAQFGGDTFAKGAAIGDWMRASINPLIASMRASPKPIVTAINGAAAGAGVGLALAGDIVIAARSARFILSFAKLGAALDAGTSLLVQRAIGAPRARALAMFGDALDGETAERWGLVWKCVDDDALMAEALKAAQRLANGPPISLGLVKAQLEAAWSADIAAALDVEADSQAKAFTTEDLREGAAAFVEKRAAVFRGR